MSAPGSPAATLLEPSRLGSAEWTYGCVASVLMHAVLPVLLVVFYAPLAELLPDRTPVEDVEIILQAELIELGKPPEPNRLPDRQVPIATTAPAPAQTTPTPEAPEPARTVTREPEPQVKPEPKPTTEPKRASQEDPLKRLGDRAQTFAEIAERQEKEGSQDASPDGNSPYARAGDAYAGKLYAFFRRGWQVPSLISPEQRRDLVTQVAVEIGSDLRIAKFSLLKTSGNKLFDQSVLDQLERLQREAIAVPPPPEEVSSQFIGRRLPIRFWGKQLG